MSFLVTGFIKYATLVILMSFFLCRCDPGDGRLMIVNLSNDTIYYITSSIDSMVEFPIEKDENEKIDLMRSNCIKPKEQHRVGTLGNWEQGINHSLDSSLHIFILTNELINTNSKDSILFNQLFSKKYKLTVSDLIAKNWTVLYPE